MLQKHAGWIESVNNWEAILRHQDNLICIQISSLPFPWWSQLLLLSHDANLPELPLSIALRRLLPEHLAAEQEEEWKLPWPSAVRLQLRSRPSISPPFLSTPPVSTLPPLGPAVSMTTVWVGGCRGVRQGHYWEESTRDAVLHIHHLHLIQF